MCTYSCFINHIIVDVIIPFKFENNLLPDKKQQVKHLGRNTFEKSWCDAIPCPVGVGLPTDNSCHPLILFTKTKETTANSE